MAWKRRSLVIASWNTEPTAWSWGSRSLCDAISCLHACQAPFDPTDRRWTPYSNFRHRCDLPICFFSVLILPPDKIPHTRYLFPTKSQTSYVKSNMDMRLMRTCKLKRQFRFLKWAAYVSILEPLFSPPQTSLFPLKPIYFPHLPALLSRN